jgi:hypothetical protein
MPIATKQQALEKTVAESVVSAQVKIAFLAKTEHGVQAAPL